MIQQAENSKEKDREEIKLRSFWLQRFLAYDVKDKITFGVAWLGRVVKNLQTHRHKVFFIYILFQSLYK